MNLQVDTRGKFPRLSGIRTIVLHDRKGRIHHVHQALLFQGPASMPSLSTLEATARRAASRRKGLPADLAALHLEGPFPTPGRHRVDVARGLLVLARRGAAGDRSTTPRRRRRR